MKYLAILHGVNEGELEIECQPLRQLSTLPEVPFILKSLF
jgi:hypothetical protein